MTPALSDQAILALLDQFFQIPAGHVIAIIDAYGGAINNTTNNATAFPQRRSLEYSLLFTMTGDERYRDPRWQDGSRFSTRCVDTSPAAPISTTATST